MDITCKVVGVECCGREEIEVELMSLMLRNEAGREGNAMENFRIQKMLRSAIVRDLPSRRKLAVCRCSRLARAGR